MRLLGKKFIPGFRIEMNDEDEDDEQLLPPANGIGHHPHNDAAAGLAETQQHNPRIQIERKEVPEQAVVRTTNRYILN